MICRAKVALLLLKRLRNIGAICYLLQPRELQALQPSSKLQQPQALDPTVQQTNLAMRILIAALLGGVALVEAFGPPARQTTRPLARADFSPIDFSTTERVDATRLNYDGTGERPQEVSDDLPEDTALRVIGPPFAFALIIIIGSQVVHFK